MSEIPQESLSYQAAAAEFFLALRGSGLLLSPLDQELVAEWERRGLPLAGGLPRAPARAGGPGSRSAPRAPRRPRSLRACRFAVEEEWRAYRRRARRRLGGAAREAGGGRGPARRRERPPRRRRPPPRGRPARGLPERRGRARGPADARRSTLEAPVAGRRRPPPPPPGSRGWRARSAPRSGPACRLLAGAGPGRRPPLRAYRETLRTHLFDAARRAGLLCLRGIGVDSAAPWPNPRESGAACTECGGAGYVVEQVVGSSARARRCACQADLPALRRDRLRAGRHRPAAQVAQVCACRHLDQRIAVFNQIGIPAAVARASFETFKPLVAGASRSAKAACEDFAHKLRTDEPSRGVLLHGKPGCGKTHLLAATLRWLALEKGVPCRYVEFMLLLSDIRAGFGSNRGHMEILGPLATRAGAGHRRAGQGARHRVGAVDARRAHQPPLQRRPHHPLRHQLLPRPARAVRGAGPLVDRARRSSSATPSP